MRHTVLAYRRLIISLVLCGGLLAGLAPRMASADACPPPASRIAPPDRDALHLALTPSPLADRWWARDKAQHAAFSFLWTLGTQYVLVNKAGWSESDALPASVGVTVTVGLSKELYDWRLGPTGRFSGKDLAANAVGILAAVGVILL